MRCEYHIGIFILNFGDFSLFFNFTELQADTKSRSVATVSGAILHKLFGCPYYNCVTLKFSSMCELSVQK